MPCCRTAPSSSRIHTGSSDTAATGPNGETLGANDIIVKYIYTGDFNLDGKVSFNDSCIFGLYYDNGSSSNNEWAFGDTNGDGLLSFKDSSNFGLDFGSGTGDPNAQDPTKL
jgi:hypothetical protein